MKKLNYIDEKFIEKMKCGYVAIQISGELLEELNKFDLKWKTGKPANKPSLEVPIKEDIGVNLVRFMNGDVKLAFETLTWFERNGFELYTYKGE